MAAAVAALDRGGGAREEREQQLTAINEGDPTAIAAAIAAFSVPGQLGKITEVERRLSRLADQAEQSGGGRHGSSGRRQTPRPAVVGTPMHLEPG